MPKTLYTAAVDLGATSGRVILGVWSKNKLQLTEAHRFPNDYRELGNNAYWELGTFWHEVQTGLRKAAALLPKGSKLSSVGVDTWGCDHVLLNDAGIKDDKKEARFFSMLQSAIDTQLVATGKKNLTQAEIKDLANGLLVRTVTDKGVLWDSSERAYNVTVPDGERAKIVAALQANNLPVTEYQILRQYTKKLEAKK